MTGAIIELQQIYNWIKEEAGKENVNHEKINLLVERSREVIENNKKDFERISSCMGKNIQEIRDSVVDISVGNFHRALQWGLKFVEEEDGLRVKFKDEEYTIGKSAESIVKFMDEFLYKIIS